MFVRVIHGTAPDRAHVRAAWDAVVRRASGSVGYLGATGGVTDSERFVGLFRFRSAPDAALIPWNGLLGAVENGATDDTVSTDVWNRGGSDDAGFVQIRIGTTTDRERFRDLYVNQQPVRMGPYRPEVLGGLFAWHGDDGFTLSAYFTSHDDARRGEGLHEFASFFADIDAVMRDVEYFDLPAPWLSSPGTTKAPAASATGARTS